MPERTREPGPALDEAVCKAFGIAGREQWYAEAPGREGAGWMFADSRAEIERIIAEATERAAVRGTTVTDWRVGSLARSVMLYPFVSREIAAAWLVVEKLREWFQRIEVHAVHLHEDAPCYVCMVEAESGTTLEHYVAHSEADTAPLAICLAALDALASLPPGRAR